MTIAACYLSPEGVVLGSDSTSTYANFGQNRHYNHGQKIFEIGEKSSLGMVTWGLGGLNFGSYRTLIARLADQLTSRSTTSVFDVAEAWIDLFWTEYNNTFSEQISGLKLLHSKKPFAGQPNGSIDTRSIMEELNYQQMKDALVVGFCLGGYVLVDRSPFAYEILFDPLGGRPSPTQLPPAQSFWGVPSLISRLITGCADELRAAILASPFWKGSDAELDSLIRNHRLAHPPTVPIREAIDFTHACLLTTIKAMKFSSLPQVCGGPIELAVITTDRMFRWVKHKRWDAAILEGTNDGHAHVG